MILAHLVPKWWPLKVSNSVWLSLLRVMYSRQTGFIILEGRRFQQPNETQTWPQVAKGGQKGGSRTGLCSWCVREVLTNISPAIITTQRREHSKLVMETPQDLINAFAMHFFECHVNEATLNWIVSSVGTRACVRVHSCECECRRAYVFTRGYGKSAVAGYCWVEGNHYQYSVRVSVFWHGSWGLCVVSPLGRRVVM